MKKIFVSGVNYRTTPLEIREKLSFNSEEQKVAIDSISRMCFVNECVLLSTCNRTEVYIYANEEDVDISLIEKNLCDIKGLSLYDYKKYFYVYSGNKAVDHVFKVTSGLDSMVLGEDQILGQVKTAYDMALQAGVSSDVLNTLLRDAITAAKKIKTNTELSRNSISVGSLTVKLLEDIFDRRLDSKCALVIGTGKIGSLALRNLCAKGIGKIYVTNRSHGKMEDLAKIYNSVQTIDYNDRYSVIDECDIIISSTSSPHYTITKDMVEKSVSEIKTRVFVDLAVPRDIDETLTEVQEVKYYNIDHIKSVMDENYDRRIAEASKAEQIIEEYTSEYEKWFEFRNALPVVKEVQSFAKEIISNRISYADSRLKNATDEDKEIVKQTITNTVNDIMDKFIYSVKKYGSKEDIQVYFRCLSEAIKEN
jgi:glutamyl-tRNA reductase